MTTKKFPKKMRELLSALMAITGLIEDTDYSDACSSLMAGCILYDKDVDFKRAVDTSIKEVGLDNKQLKEVTSLLKDQL